MRVHLTATAAAAVRRGHPWVYRDGIAGGGNAAQRGERRRGERARGEPARGDAAATGDVVELSAEGATFLGRGLWDAESAIAVRVFQRTQAPQLDERALAERLERAFALRDGWFAGRDTTAYRLCNGEGDRVPSLVIDRYDRAAVVRLDGGMLAPWLDRLLPHLARALGARGVRSIGLRARGPSAGADAEGKKLAHLHGPPLPDRLFVRESGVAMEVDLARGQKTGAFLDQRDNRARVRALAAGRRRVLNLFSYAGGFSVAAALGGAGRVTSVDSASAAHASAQRTFRENGVDPAAHEFVTADAFDFLEKAHARGDRYDLIICDPPSFAPNERVKPRALGAYRRLHTAVARVLDRGGVLCAASCSSHITAEDFLATLDDATLERDDLRVRAVHGQPEDHPTLPAWWEGRYLKFVVLE
ncbi:class I SAM-dependent rRNA methyltransferase [Sorangium sp. So ce1099]|uniref:class I SAM-dependent rRNA methyltransferase n=1 Tax=Sorangium sp. So ce1099 TaxID=3133331 RepID=UPI003F62BCAE